MGTGQLRGLRDNELAYVRARATTTTIKEACEIASIATRTWEKWPRERRDHLNALAMEYKSSAAERALESLQAKVPALLEELLGLVTQSRDKRLKLSAIREALDRALGKATAKHEYGSDPKRPMRLDVSILTGLSGEQLDQALALAADLHRTQETEGAE